PIHRMSRSRTADSRATIGHCFLPSAIPGPSFAGPEAHLMNPSIPRPTGPRGSPSGSALYRDPTDFWPIPGPAEEGPRRSRIGIPRLAFWSYGRIGLLLLGLIVLPLLPISGPPRGATPARRVRGFKDSPVAAIAFAPGGAMIATIQTDGRVALRDVAGGGGAPRLPGPPGPAGPGVSPPRPGAPGRGGRARRPPRPAPA